MDPTLFSKVLSLYENGKFIPKNKRKATAGESSQSLLEKKTAAAVPVAPAAVMSTAAAAAAAAAVLAKPKNIVDSIYDSIYDDLPMEKYDPLATATVTGPTEAVKKKKIIKRRKKPKREPENVAVIFTDSEEEEEELEETEEEVEIPPSQSLKGLFQNVKQTVVQIPKPPPQDSSNTLTSLFTSAVRTATHSKETLSSVSSLLKKDKQLEELHSKYGVTDNTTTTTSSSSTTTKKRVTLAEEEEEEKKKKALIHRDVFASTLENVVYVDSKYGKKEGEKFGPAAEGVESYDIFPETTGAFGEVKCQNSVVVFINNFFFCTRWAVKEKRKKTTTKEAEGKDKEVETMMMTKGKEDQRKANSLTILVVVEVEEVDKANPPMSP
jgi:hypothetical protein